MKEVYRNLFVGDLDDYRFTVKDQDGWAIVHACKEPYHREALGYTGRGAPKEHPEYLVARRGHRLILNMIDPKDPAYIPTELVDAGLEFIHEQLSTEKRVLVHCNEGRSRSPGLALLYLARFTDVLPTTSYHEATLKFREIYPAFFPSNGVSGFLDQRWDQYVTRASG
jgi:predicted protein tyrosine phosphatase